MSHTLSFYSTACVTLSVAALFGVSLWAISRWRPRFLSPKTLVPLFIALAFAAIAVVFLPIYEGSAPIFKFEAPVKIWSANSFQTKGAVAPRPILNIQDIKVPLEAAERAKWIPYLVLIFAISIWLGNLFKIFRLFRSSIRIRKIGRVSILVHEKIRSPLSFRLPGVVAVVVPPWIIEHARYYRLAVSHEIQHHRAGDTLTAHIFSFLQAILFWNPLIRAWDYALRECQEMACDEALIARKNISRSEYQECLIKAAEYCATSRFSCATGLSWFLSKDQLKKRLTYVQNFTKNESGRRQKYILATSGVGAILLIVASVFVAKNFIHDSRISLEQAKQIAAKTSRETSFPIVVNEQVVKHLNRYLSTPNGREFLQETIKRFESLRPMLEAKARLHNAPWELLAIPVVESGYKNLPQWANPSKAAGAWQFMRQTARNYGLKVDGQSDERLDAEKAADAALRYLTGSKAIYGNWPLAILSYNAGFKLVDRGIAATRSQDAFELIRAGFEGDKDYLPKVMAAVLILKNPSMLN